MIVDPKFGGQGIVVPFLGWKQSGISAKQYVRGVGVRIFFVLPLRCCEYVLEIFGIDGCSFRRREAVAW